MDTVVLFLVVFARHAIATESKGAWQHKEIRALVFSHVKAKEVSLFLMVNQTFLVVRQNFSSRHPSLSCDMKWT